MSRYKTFRLAALLALATAIATPRPTRAQNAADRAVRAVVDSFFAAVKREQWDSAVALIDLPRFEPYFKQTVRNARTMLPQPELTVEELMARDSTMPRAAAEWQIRIMNKRYETRAFGDMSYEFTGVKTLQMLFALTLPEAAARWLQSQDLRTQWREAFARSGCPLAAMSSSPPGSTHIVFATMRADDSTAYVLHGDDGFPGNPTYLQGAERVMVLHRSGGHWRIEPRRNLLRPENSGVSYSMECPKGK
jgi:hypothetical protein